MTREEAERIAAKLVTVVVVPRYMCTKSYFHCVFVAGREVAATLSEKQTDGLAVQWRDAIVRALVGE